MIPWIAATASTQIVPTPPPPYTPSWVRKAVRTNGLRRTSFTWGTSQFWTLSLWLRVDTVAASQNQYIIHVGPEGSSADWAMRINIQNAGAGNPGHIQLNVRDAATGGNVLCSQFSANPIAPGAEGSHYLFSFRSDAGNKIVKMFEDGVQINTATFVTEGTIDWDTSARFSLFTSNANNQGLENSDLADVFFWHDQYYDDPTWFINGDGTAKDPGADGTGYGDGGSSPVAATLGLGSTMDYPDWNAGDDLIGGAGYYTITGTTPFADSAIDPAPPAGETLTEADIITARDSFLGTYFVDGDLAPVGSPDYGRNCTNAASQPAGIIYEPTKNHIIARNCAVELLTTNGLNFSVGTLAEVVKWFEVNKLVETGGGGTHRFNAGGKNYSAGEWAFVQCAYKPGVSQPQRYIYLQFYIDNSSKFVHFDCDAAAGAGQILSVSSPGAGVINSGFLKLANGSYWLFAEFQQGGSGSTNRQVFGGYTSDGSTTSYTGVAGRGGHWGFVDLTKGAGSVFPTLWPNQDSPPVNLSSHDADQHIWPAKTGDVDGSQTRYRWRYVADADFLDPEASFGAWEDTDLGATPPINAQRVFTGHPTHGRARYQLEAYT